MTHIHKLGIREKLILKTINGIEDIPKERQLDMINSVLDLPCYQFSFQELKEKYPHLMANVDLTKIPKEEVSTKLTFSPNDLLFITTGDQEIFNRLVHDMNCKAIYRKAYQAYIQDKDEMNPAFDPFRARCQVEFESWSAEEPEDEK